MPSKESVFAVIVVMLLTLPAGLLQLQASSAQSGGSMAPYSQPEGRRLGFWVAEDDIFGGAPIFGNTQGFAPTPQQFYNFYFMTQPYPTTMVFTGGMSYGSSIESTWLNQLLSITDSNANILIWSIFFVNLSGYSIEGAQQAPAPSTGLSSVGFSVRRASPLTTFNIGNSAGLSPNSQYTINMMDINLNLIASVTTFTTNSTGGWTGTTGLPNTTDAQANAGGYLVVQGTHVGLFIGWQNDQTTDFTGFMNSIKGHPSFMGALFEPEYFGNNPTIQASFANIVNGAGYYVLGGTNNPAGGQLAMRYSSYPYFGGSVYTGTAPIGELGVHYGETGSPIPPDPQPIWTSSTVLNIIQNSEVAPITIIIAVNDASNPIGDSYLYMNPTFRSWISSSAYYETNFLKANGPYITTTTTTTSPTNSGSTTTSPLATAGIVFSSYFPSTAFSYGTNFQTAGNYFTLQVPTIASINMIAFYFSDRAYDTNPVPFTITGPGVSTTGIIPGLLQFASQQYYPIQLNQTVTLQANTPYIVRFASLPSGDSYGLAGISQDILTEAAVPGATYLGLPQWPIFEVGMMNLLSQSAGLAYHNYGGYTDLFSSPGYQGNGEIGMRFMASRNERLQTFGVLVWSSSGSSDQLTFALRPDVGGHPGTSASNIATASLAASQMPADTFATTSFPTTPQLTGGNYYWIVVSSPSGTQPVVLGRLVNPYREYVLYSPNDFASSWGVPADGPTDLGFRITTSSESIVNTVSGSDVNDYFSGVAQSFIPAVSTQIGGGWVSAAPAGETMSVSIQTDSNDVPSGTVLASGSDQVLTQLHAGSPFVYVGFANPVSVTPGTKYWLVATIGPCLSLSCSFPSRAATLTFASDYSQSGFAPPSGTHYETLSGSTWTSVPNGAMTFELVAPASASVTPPVSTTTATSSSTSIVSPTSTTSSASSSSVATGIDSIILSGPTSVSAGGFSQYLASVYVNGVSPVGITVNWYVDGSLAWTESTGQGSGSQPVGWAWFNDYWTQGTHTLYAVAVGTESNEITIFASSSSSTTTGTSTTSTSSSTTTTQSLQTSLAENTTSTLKTATTTTSTESLSSSSMVGPIIASAPDFQLSMDSGSATLYQGGESATLIRIFSDSLDSPSVRLQIRNVPPGVTVTLEPDKGLAPFNSVLTIDAGLNAISGNYRIAINANTSGGNITVNYVLHVEPFSPAFCNVNIHVQDIYGMPIAGANVTLVLADDSTRTAVTNESGIASFRPLPVEAYSSIVSYMGLQASSSGNTLSSPSIYVTLVLSYPVALTFVAFVTVAILAFSIRWFRHRSLPYDLT